MTRVRIGTAAWSIPRAVAHRFPQTDASRLERYASVMSGVEINSSFYRPHRTSTYARWAASVPRGFRFAAKVPKTITHERRLVDAERPFAVFLDEVRYLGGRLGPLLVQLPPSLAYDARVASRFFAMVRKHHGGPIVFEPRNASWFTPATDALLVRHSIARVMADPSPYVVTAPGPLVYLRLHGSPRVYFSSYDALALDALAQRMREWSKTAETWCIFDNTALGAATENALALRQLIAA